MARVLSDHQHGAQEKTAQTLQALAQPHHQTQVRQAQAPVFVPKVALAPAVLEPALPQQPRLKLLLLLLREVLAVVVAQHALVRVQ